MKKKRADFTKTKLNSPKQKAGNPNLAQRVQKKEKNLRHEIYEQQCCTVRHEANTTDIHSVVVEIHCVYKVNRLAFLLGPSKIL